MKNILTKTIILVLAIVGLFSISTPVFAAGCTDICTCDSVSDEVKSSSGCKNVEPTTSLEDSIISILNGVIGILAVVAVVVIVIGGVQYMTSAGDPGKTKKAKDTILYACIGLIICALAAVIVNFVVASLLGNSSGDERETTFVEGPQDANPHH